MCIEKIKELNVEGAALQDQIEELQRQQNAINFKIKEQKDLAMIDAGFDPDDIEYGDWGCEDSPFGTCAYNYKEDPALDFCVFCGLPDERK